MTRKYLTPQELSDMLKIPTGTLSQWRFHGRGPRYFKDRKTIRYDVADVQEWIDRNKVKTEAI